jgi:methylated-DNA-[protein]-cysteine S-methyltransferase
MNIECAEMASPVGRLSLAVSSGRLIALCFEGHWQKRHAALKQHFGDATFVSSPDPARVVTRLKRYFDGDLGVLAGIETESWGTPFQESVWRQLRLIPVGETRSYSELAIAIGTPAAVRAVGAANGANPVGIVVPCHRVIGSDGKLTGFAGGLPRKKWLLDHEGAQVPMFAPKAVRRAA